MSTVHREMSDEEIAGMVADLKEWPSVGHNNGDYELAVMPFITFYFTYDPERSLETSMAMIDVHEDFENLLGHPYKVQTHPDSERPHSYGSKRLGDLREWAHKTRTDQHFVFNVTDDKNHRNSPTNAGYFWRSAYRSWSTGNYSYLQLYYRWQWWLDNQEAWRRFVQRTIERLRPEQVYSGFSMANPLEFGTRSEVTVWDRALPPHFYGLDTDYPFGMHGSPDLPAGVRPPTWGFFFSDLWREKLSIDRQEVRTALADPRIRIDDLNCGQWIELGPQPELYPVEDGVPELPVLLNRLLRPLRHTRLDLLGFGEWDGDPNERFSMFDSRRWLARFDEDSDWPTAEVRGLSPDAPQAPPPIGHARDGEPCPRTGWWITSAKHGHRQYLEEGQPMPAIEHESTAGLTLWSWAPDQRGDNAPPVPEPAKEARSLEPAPRAGLWLQAGNALVRCRVAQGDSLPLLDGVSATWLWTESPPHAMRSRSGEPCPYPGVWYCEDFPVGPRAFMHGVPMPQVQGRNVTWFLVSTS